MFEHIAEDYRTHDRELTRQGLWALVVHRFGAWRYQIRWRLIRAPLSVAYRALKLASQILTGIDIPCEALIGRRLCIEHFGGIIVSGDAVIGNDVTLRNGVTIGLRRKDQPGAPVIGNRVDIGTGAKIIGAITIGDDVSIGANAVVLQDVPSGATAVGIPARIITSRSTGVPVAS